MHHGNTLTRYQRIFCKDAAMASTRVAVLLAIVNAHVLHVLYC